MKFSIEESLVCFRYKPGLWPLYRGKPLPCHFYLSHTVIEFYIGGPHGICRVGVLFLFLEVSSLSFEIFACASVYYVNDFI